MTTLVIVFRTLIENLPQLAPTGSARDRGPVPAPRPIGPVPGDLRGAERLLPPVVQGPLRLDGLVEGQLRRLVRPRRRVHIDPHRGHGRGHAAPRADAGACTGATESARNDSPDRPSIAQCMTRSPDTTTICRFATFGAPPVGLRANPRPASRRRRTSSPILTPSVLCATSKSTWPTSESVADHPRSNRPLALVWSSVRLEQFSIKPRSAL